MRLLFVIHYCSPDVNDNALGPVYLGEAGHQVLVISSRYAKSLKGEVRAKEREIIGGTEFFRPYPEWLDLTNKPWSHWDDVVRRVDDFKPDVVIGFGEFNYKLSLALSRHYSIPYILYVEYLNPVKFSAPVRGKALLMRAFPSFYKLISSAFQAYLKRNVAAIMYAYYGDKLYEEKLIKRFPHVYYVPWCTDTGDFEQNGKKGPGTGIYIGSLEVFKNSQVLLDMVAVILDRTGTRKFTVVGPGSLAPAARKLHELYGERFEYRESVTREEALRLISNSSYGFTTVKDCGLGFIGDCWGVGTPLVSMYDLDGFLNQGEDCLVASNADDLVVAVDELLYSESLSQRLINSGKARHNSNYTARAVGEKYVDVIRKATG